MKFSGQLHDPVPHLRGKSPGLQDLEVGGCGGIQSLASAGKRTKILRANNITL